jgi:hypothetical protein
MSVHGSVSQSVTPTGSPKSIYSEPGRGVKDLSGAKYRFHNGWMKEQEDLLADWSDIAQCYRWLHDRSYKLFHIRNLGMSIPVIVLSTVSGAASVALGNITNGDATAQKWGQVAIGAISIFAGIMQTLAGTFGFAQLSEGHRVASISWGKLQRRMAVELQLSPDDRMDCMGFIDLARQEMDRLIEQSPSIPEIIIKRFDTEFDKQPNLKQPDICGGIEHTRIYRDNKRRLAHVTAESVLHLKLRKKLLRQEILPDLDAAIQKVIDARYSDRVIKIEEEKSLDSQNLSNNLVDIELGPGTLVKNTIGSKKYATAMSIMSRRRDKVEPAQAVYSILPDGPTLPQAENAEHR